MTSRLLPEGIPCVYVSLWLPPTCLVSLFSVLVSMGEARGLQQRTVLLSTGNYDVCHPIVFRSHIHHKHLYVEQIIQLQERLWSPLVRFRSFLVGLVRTRRRFHDLPFFCVVVVSRFLIVTLVVVTGGAGGRGRGRGGGV
jgi:hypothetical protein